ncbi:MAG: response regulator, partial [Spirochaetales bacterium]|nr:response regulator [Spirochaetales bacterium]
MWQTDLSLVRERLLLVDDDSNLLAILKRYAEMFTLDADTATNGREAVELLAKNEYGVVITDMVMPEMDGMELIQHIREFHPQCDVLVISGYSGQYGFSDLISAGATDFIGKPFERDELQAKLQRIFRERRLIAELYKAKVEAEM